MDVVGIDPAPVAELGPDPVAAVGGRAADVGQDHPVAARDEEGDLQAAGRAPRLPAVRHGCRRPSAGRRRPAPGGEAIQSRSARPRPGRGRAASPAGGRAACQRRANRGAGDAADRRRRSSARAPARRACRRPRPAGHRRATASGRRRPHRPASGRGSAAAPAGRRVERELPGQAAPAIGHQGDEAIRRRPRTGRGGRSPASRGGRCRPRTRPAGRAPGRARRGRPCRRPPGRSRCPGSGRRAGPASITPMAASQRPSGENAGWLAWPPRRRISTGSPARRGRPRQIVSLGPASAWSARSAAKTSDRPSGSQLGWRTPQSPGVRRRGRASRPNRDDEQVLPAIDVALLVPAPVGPVIRRPSGARSGSAAGPACGRASGIRKRGGSGLGRECESIAAPVTRRARLDAVNGRGQGPRAAAGSPVRARAGPGPRGSRTAPVPS